MSEKPPFSDLASPVPPERQREGAEAGARFAEAWAASTGDIADQRRIVDELYLRPGWERLRAAFPVTIERDEVGGVPVDVVTPADGVPRDDRVLINLHGGSLTVAAGLGGQQESIPVASLGGFRVITVDYRLTPENVYPAASEDVAAVYRSLLDRYEPERIGIYGCSSGGYLTAAALAWFQRHGLPRPGAIGIFGEGAVSATERWGDSVYTTAALAGTLDLPPDGSIPGPEAGPYFAGVDVDDPLVSPGLFPDVLREFPPTLLLSGTRDIGMSSILHLHAQLVRVGVDARLHVWEGEAHCSFAQGFIDPDRDEVRQAWDVIVRFFDSRLGGRGA